jgi:hypothetical protein
MVRYEFIPTWMIVFAAVMIGFFSTAMIINLFITISFYKVYVASTLSAAAISYYVEKRWL